MGVSTFSDMEIDAIGEIMNISLGASATAVSTMLNNPTNITTPVVRVMSRSDFEYKDLDPAVGVEISYTVGLDGTNVMMFSRDDVRKIVGMMMGMEIPEEEFVLDEMNESAIREVMNMMMGSSATALSEFLGYPVDISTPKSFEVTSEEEFKDKYFPGEDERVVVRFNLVVGDQIESEFLNIMTTNLVKRLLEPFRESMGLGEDTSASADEAPAQDAPQEQPQEEPKAEAPAAEEAPAPAAEPAPAPEPMSDEDAAAKAAQVSSQQRGMSQSETDALLASLKAEAAGDAAPAPTAEPAGSGKAMSQAETDALLASLKAGNAEPASTAATPQSTVQQAAPSSEGGSGKAMSQAETDALLAAMKAGNSPAPAAEPAPAPAPAPAPQVAPAPQAAAPQGYPQQPMYYAPPAPDPMMMQLLNQMQQSQNQMMQMMKDMEEDRKAREEAAQARREAAAAKKSQNKGIVTSMDSERLADTEGEGIEEEENREMLMKVPLEISVEIGRTMKPVKDILELTQGSLVVLDKMAGEQADLYVNGECIARGDIVVVEDNFGIRITEIVNKDIYQEKL